ncbi:hypothetical protein WJX75_006517 [Coccomyxa subellipsoidea]|uniref:MYND-type domain-containing protein n=1 Tax=Coccomyxa subellipsoidea TaxID=248742 RepID=A0ABR2YI88_9CHLO
MRGCGQCTSLQISVLQPQRFPVNSRTLAVEYSAEQFAIMMEGERQNKTSETFTEIAYFVRRNPEKEILPQGTQSRESKACTGCHMVRYCSLQCQREAWWAHKEHCRCGTGIQEATDQY